MKCLPTGSKQTVEVSGKRWFFACNVRFLDRFKVSENSLCNVFREQASRHMSEFSSKFGVVVTRCNTSFFGDSI